MPIPSETTTTIINALKRFKQTALDFDVPQKFENVRILATEATRTALNSAEFIKDIEKALGEPWKVNLLAKEDEGRIGALGVVSSVGGSDGIEGLMMDLGGEISLLEHTCVISQQYTKIIPLGGSTQLTWLIARPGTPLQTSPQGSISFPYGAAAMTRLLSEQSTESQRTTLHNTMVSQFREAFSNLALPDHLLSKARSHGLSLYLSGGGFRGWGYLLMSSHRLRPYPIPIINGFTVPVKDFRNTLAVSELAAQSLGDKDTGGAGIFRVSKRRAAQVPAVSFLVDALLEAIPVVREVRFCQGGVREGWLFDSFSSDLRAQDPLTASSERFAIDIAFANKIASMLEQALPPDSMELDRYVPARVRDPNLLCAFANLMYLQQGHSKEGAAVNALHVPITGALANAHGAGHCERALLSLMLCRRWGEEDDLPPPYGELKGRLELLLTQQEVWWARYLGVVGSAVGDVYPVGRAAEGVERLTFLARWADGLGKKGNQHGVRLVLKIEGGKDFAMERGWDVVELVEGIEALGKKKNRAGGKEYGYGMPIRVDIASL